MKRLLSVLSLATMAVVLVGIFTPVAKPDPNAPRHYVLATNSPNLLATITKYNQFVENLGKGVHNLNTDTIKIALTNTAPNVSTHTVRADITELSTGNGYTSGGGTVASTAYSQSSGTGKLSGNAVTFTASGGSIGPFRYAVFYDDTPTSPADPLIGYLDYGTNLTLTDGSTFTVGKDNAGGNWDSTTPILSITRSFRMQRRASDPLFATMVAH